MHQEVFLPIRIQSRGKQDRSLFEARAAHRKLMILSGGKGETVTYAELCFGKYGNSVWNELELIEMESGKISYVVIMFRKRIIRS